MVIGEITGFPCPVGVGSAQPGTALGMHCLAGALRNHMHRLLTTLLALGSVSVGGCAAAMIPNTSVEDTSDNRQVVEFVEDYRRAVEAET